MNAQTHTPAELVAQLAVVTEERDRLRRDLGHAYTADQLGRLRLRYNTTPKESALILALHGARGRVVSQSGLLDAMYGGMDEPEAKIIDVFVCKIRKKLGRDAIENVHGAGYRLTDAGVERVVEAVTVAPC